MFQIIPSDKIPLVSVFVSKLVPIDRKILWEINSACKLEMEIRRTLEEQCPLGAILRVPTSTNFANTQVYQNAGNLFRDFDSKIRYRNWKKKKNKILFRSLLLWFIRGERRKYGDSQCEYIGSLLSRWLEIRFEYCQLSIEFSLFSFLFFL